jgi:hypothetical protein
MGPKEAVLFFVRKARAIETRQFFKELLYFAGFLGAEFDRGHIAAFGESIGCKLTPRTAQLLGIQMYLNPCGVTFPKRRRRSVGKRNRQWIAAHARRLVADIRAQGFGSALTLPLKVSSRRFMPVGFPFALVGPGDLLALPLRLSRCDRFRRSGKSSGPPPFAPSLNVQGDDAHNNSGFSVI